MTEHAINESYGAPTGTTILTRALRWLTTTNHKDIGTLYLWLSLIMFFVAGFMAMLIRVELFQPGMQILDPNHYNGKIAFSPYTYNQECENVTNNPNLHNSHKFYYHHGRA